MQEIILVLTIQHGRLDNNKVAQTGGLIELGLICLVHLKPGQTNVLFIPLTNQRRPSWLHLGTHLNTIQSTEFNYFYLQYNCVFFFAYD